MKIADRRQRIKRRVRSTMIGTEARPRISVCRSNKYLYAQAIDDVNAKTLCAICSKSSEANGTVTKKQASEQAGVQLAELLKAKKITAAIFDRGWHAYKGRVQVFADALRKNGITV